MIYMLRFSCALLLVNYFTPVDLKLYEPLFHRILEDRILRRCQHMCRRMDQPDSRKKQSIPNPAEFTGSSWPSSQNLNPTMSAKRNMNTVR